MSNHLTTVAQAITDELNDNDWDLDFTAERKYQTQFHLEDLGVLKVEVVAVNEPESELDAPGLMGYHVSANVVVRYRFKQEEVRNGEVIPERVDPYIDLVFAINDALAKQLLDEASAHWEKTKILVAYSPTFLEENQQFLGVVQVTYYANSEV